MRVNVCVRVYVRVSMYRCMFMKVQACLSYLLLLSGNDHACGGRRGKEAAVVQAEVSKAIPHFVQYGSPAYFLAMTMFVAAAEARKRPWCKLR